jgi:predicted short-subunit dehydrogenase-like oxidoreductase (DUF2520 family)
MRELERDDLPSPLNAAPLVVVGRGRVGGSLARAAEAAGIEVRTAGRDEVAAAAQGAGAVLLCVPDSAIAATAAEVPEGPGFVGHVSGAGTLNLLADAAARGARAFSLHPLQTFARGDTPVEGTPAAIAGSDRDALRFARQLAEALGMRPFEVAEEDRSAYHAAAAIASNLLIPLEESAAELLESLGTDEARELLAPLVLRTTANWVELGPRALTGPIARGDQTTIDGHRAALRERAPELLPLYDILAERAQAIAAQTRADSAGDPEEPPIGRSVPA